ncbi:MAG: acyl transferase, partial [Bacteroidota bacterium]
LPSYLERSGSSLVYMVQSLIESSGHPRSGFYLNDFYALHQTLKKLEAAEQKTILIGVSYALFDFAEAYPMELKHTIIMDTGGMKGRKEELTRTELNNALQHGFGVNEIHSEYGMTELLSQAYAVNGIFSSPPWMKIILRDETDPLTQLPLHANTSGAINVIDLANLYSCSFIATADAGRYSPDGTFEVLGRLDNADVRGCSLMFV